MIYAIISDIHANIEALNAVLSDISYRTIDKCICLGDIVGYCVNPSEAISKIQKFDLILMGNHDNATFNKAIVEKFNIHARLAIEWTINTLTDEEKCFLGRLPYYSQEGHATFVHATPRNPENWGYIMYIDEALDAFNYFDTQICFFGHTHQTLVITDRGIRHHEKKITLIDDTRYLINVGSVGQPRDSNPMSCYGIYDSDKKTFEYIRVKYDIDKTQNSMIKAKFHPFLIQRLSDGR